MKKKILDIIAVSSIISGVFITVCDYLVQMRSTETEQFVSRLLVLDGVSITLLSYVCIFAFLFWIIGLYLVYLTTHLTQYNFNLNHFKLELKFFNEDVLFL